MCSKLASIVRVLLVIGMASAPGAAVLLAQGTTRVSVDSQGAQAQGGDSYYSAMSADGRFVVFQSSASNLVPDDTNGCRDVFVHDRLLGKTVRASVDSQGAQGYGDSGTGYGYSPGISADGRFVVFDSQAGLAPEDQNINWDVFVHDMQTGETRMVDVSSLGEQANNGAGDAAISANGRFVAFGSYSDNLVSGDTNHEFDVFVHDRETGETERVSIDSAGRQSNRTSGGGRLSADGRFVVFESQADNLVAGDTNTFNDIFLHDLQTGETKRMSVDPQGAQSNGQSNIPNISADGRFVVFSSGASNLISGDTNNQSDIFVHNRQTGENQRVSVSSQGEQANGYSGSSFSIGISADGRCVAFTSDATNLVRNDTNWATDIFVHDGQTGETTRVSVDYSGVQANGYSRTPAISDDGRFVSFESVATSLVPGDTNGYPDVFVRDRDAAPCSFPATWSNYGSGWPGTNGVPGIVAVSNPVLCASVLVSADNSYGLDTAGILIAGFTSASLPTVWGGTVLVRPALVSPVPVPPGGLSLFAPIPCDDALCGLALYAQVIEIDPGASLGISFTPGLELRLGVQ